jgi:hypothetical protein
MLGLDLRKAQVFSSFNILVKNQYPNIRPKAGLDAQTLRLRGPHFVYRVKVLASLISIVCGSITVRK